MGLVLTEAAMALAVPVMAAAAVVATAPVRVMGRMGKAVKPVAVAAVAVASSSPA